MDALTVAYGLALAVAGLARVVTSSGLVRRGRLPAAVGFGSPRQRARHRSVGDLGRASVDGDGDPGPLRAPRRRAWWSGSRSTFAWERGLVGPTTGLVVELGSRAGGTLRDRLATVLGDPSLVVGYARPGGGIRRQGRPTRSPSRRVGSDRAVLPVRQGTEVVSVIVHDGERHRRRRARGRRRRGGPARGRECPTAG